VIGTGSTAVPASRWLAEAAEHLTVFQRSPNFSVPARNRPIDSRLSRISARAVPEVRAELLASVGGQPTSWRSAGPLSDYSEAAANETALAAWQTGGHGISYLFADQETNDTTNEAVSEFVRSKIRSIVKDPAVAENLCAPMIMASACGRLCLDNNYYATYNRRRSPSSTSARHPIERITPTGIITGDGRHHDIDLIVFAIGFESLHRRASPSPTIRNEKGERPDRPLEARPEDYAPASPPPASPTSFPLRSGRAVAARQLLPAQRI